VETFRYSRHPGGFDVVFLDSDSPRVQSEIGGRTLIGPRIRYALDFRKYRVVQEFLFTGAPLIGPQIRNIFARTGHFLVVNVRLLQQVFKVFAPIELVCRFCSWTVEACQCSRCVSNRNCPNSRGAGHWYKYLCWRLGVKLLSVLYSPDIANYSRSD
jgi:hypothetical protein